MACLERKTWMFLVFWETGKAEKLLSSTQGRFLSEGCSLEVFSALVVNPRKDGEEIVV